MNKKYPLFLIALAIIGLCGCAHFSKDKNTLFQYSTINALMAGLYDGELTAGRLKEYGDLGLGTFTGVDGELILLGGACYQAKPGGAVSVADSKAGIPFAVAKYFKPSMKVAVRRPLNYKQLTEFSDTLMPADNLFLAIKIEGDFSFVKTRSIAKQSKPYPLFSEVAKAQSICEFSNIKGTLVGFRFPDYMKELNVPGYHFHFISQDKQRGGHLLECNFLEGTIEIERARRFFIVLPDDKEFCNTDLSKDRQQELYRAEK